MARLHPILPAEWWAKLQGMGTVSRVYNGVAAERATRPQTRRQQ